MQSGKVQGPKSQLSEASQKPNKNFNLSTDADATNASADDDDDVG